MSLQGIDLWEFELFVFIASAVLVVVILQALGYPVKTWSLKTILWVVFLEAALLVAGYYFWLFFLVQWE